MWRLRLVENTGGAGMKRSRSDETQPSTATTRFSAVLVSPTQDYLKLSKPMERKLFKLANRAQGCTISAEFRGTYSFEQGCPKHNYLNKQV
jgi:hypothetical protein